MIQLQYKKVLIIGASGGLGRALAAKLVETGTSVIAVGRRKERLDEFAKRYGNLGQATVDTAVLNITNLKKIPRFATTIFDRHPDIDCVFLNSGVQRAVNFADPATIDLEAVDMEVLTNYTSFMHLTKAFLPYLQKQAPKLTAMIYTTSGLALVPILHCPVYCATKAALHHTILAMREQLREVNSNVRIIELFPPAVQTELHDFEMGDRGKDVGMPLDDFTEEAFEGMCKEGIEGEQIPVQAAKTSFYGWEQQRQKTMFDMIEMMRK